jgi:ubiquinone/menaquinone biosynthesis C-methylase UbiE
MLENGFSKIAGLDPSITLLRYAKSRLGDGFHPVQGIAENLPFRDGSFAGALTCFSLRDVRDRASSLREFSRVIEDKGQLEIVDIGKPDNLFLRKLASLYIALAMPIIARFLISGRLRGNPFRMIIPTVQSLMTNHALAQLVARIFGSSSLREFLFGGLIIVEGERTKQKL